MSKIYCEYDHSNPKEEIADHKCDVCEKILCHICGYRDGDYQYCNECWEDHLQEEGEGFWLCKI